MHFTVQAELVATV